MLTPHQQQALSRAHHLSVTANAGSGKTRVLVERYLEILLRGEAEVSEVVALTYTEKAASELKRKIADAITLRFAASGESRLEVIRGQLPAAWIGTIHSFCARVLREFPVEAGVDAAFSVIEGLDQHMLLQETMNETFSSLIRDEPGSPLRESFVEAVRRLGKAGVVRTVARLVEKREMLERLAGEGGLYRMPDGDILAFWKTGIRAAAENMLGDPVLRTDLERVMNAADGKAAAEARAIHRSFAEARSPEIRLQLGSTLLEMLLKKDGGLYRSIVTAPVEERLRHESARLAHVRSSLAPLLAIDLDPSAEEDHRALLGFTRTILEVVQRSVERYEEKKLEGGRLDFEDLQLRARALLRREPVRAHLARRFRYIMVDEYQDTNDLQYDILLPLLTDLGTGNLFIVGDPKQSIYSFRNANVAVFQKTRGDINLRAGEQGDVVLEESFRPLRDLVAFVNMVFEPLMASAGRGPEGDRENYEVAYDPLVRARQNPASGRVEVLVNGHSSGEEDPGESENLVLRLLRLVGERHPVYDVEERARDIRYRDIAILLRSRTLLPDLEAACTRLGLPYVVSGGVGYFQTQDILDYFNYLQFLVNPRDDVALAGILRSPFFAVSDTDLFEEAGRLRSGSLWEYLRPRHGRGGLPESLSRAVASLTEDLDVCPRLPVTELLARIVQRRLYLGKVAGTTRGAQAVANLEKLQRMARSYEIQGFTTLFDFTRRLRRLIDEEEGEGQGTIEAQTDAVQIMTVHAAKGLEFPVVVLPHLTRQFQYDNDPFVSDRFGIGVSFDAPDGQERKIPLTEYLRAEGRRKTIAEEKRIFYVACTRARDMLILSGRLGGKRTAATWMNWLLDGLQVDEEFGAERLEFERSTAILTAVDGHFVSGSERHSLTVHVIRPSAAMAAPASQTLLSREPGEPVIRAKPLEAGSKGEIFSATRIKTFRECPGAYYLRYVLGFPSEGSGTVGGGDDELRDREFPAEIRGRVFHAAMQNIDRVAPSGGGIEDEVGKALTVETAVDAPQAQPLVAEIASAIRAVLATPLWREVSAGVETRTEFTISCTLGDDFLSGTMDRVYRDASGTWHLLDYKTDRVDLKTVARKADSYWPQLEFYALLIQKFFGASRVSATLLFTSLVDKPIRRVFEAGEIAAFESEIRVIVGRIKAGDFRPTKVPCSACPFQPEGCQFLLYR